MGGRELCVLLHEVKGIQFWCRSSRTDHAHLIFSKLRFSEDVPMSGLPAVRAAHLMNVCNNRLTYVSLREIALNLERHIILMQKVGLLKESQSFETSGVIQR